MKGALVSVGCVAVLVLAGCSSDDKPRFTADAWVEFQDGDAAFAASASGALDRFEACIRKVKSEVKSLDRLRDCGYALDHAGRRLDDSLYSGEDYNVTTDSLCGVALTDLNVAQHDLALSLGELGSAGYGSRPFEGSDALLSAVSRKLDQLESARRSVSYQCSPQS
jgi:hypothetical protein